MSRGLQVVRTDASSGGASTSSSSAAAAPSSAFGPPDSGLLDRGYAGSCSALLKVAQMLLLLIGFICIIASQVSTHSTYTYFKIVSMFDLVMIFIFYVVYVFRIYRMMTCINWPLAEFLHYLIGTTLLLIGSVVVVSRYYGLASLTAGAVFGFLASFLCILSIWLSYKVSCVTQSTDAAV